MPCNFVFEMSIVCAATQQKVNPKKEKNVDDDTHTQWADDDHEMERERKGEITETSKVKL